MCFVLLILKAWRLENGVYNWLCENIPNHKSRAWYQMIQSTMAWNGILVNHTMTNCYILCQLGAVAFLYHPCTPQEQVTALRDLAHSCLWKHVITPYPHLSEDKVSGHACVIALVKIREMQVVSFTMLCRSLIVYYTIYIVVYLWAYFWDSFSCTRVQHHDIM